MRRYWMVLAFCAFAFLFLVQLSSADGLLKINLAKTQAEVSDEKINLTLAIDNASARALQSHIVLEILDPQNRVLATSEKTETLKPALHIVDFDISLEHIVGKTHREIFWYRLRYRLVTNGNTTSGIIALSEIAADFFELRATAPFATFTGNRYGVRVVAARPFTGSAISGVKITGEIKFASDEDEKTLRSSAITNREGYALLNFELPIAITEPDIELKITGEYKGLVQEVEDEIQALRGNRFFVNSDKLIYQPGQTLHVRALLLDAQRHALANQGVTLKIVDQDQSVVYRAALKTSAFGIASADWPIPANTRLGKYEIKFRLTDGDVDFDGYWHSDYEVRISRYELPNFTVNTRPDRTYYLPGQNPQVGVRGDYLFGQPVTGGQVKVVRETEGHWNFREQKWEVKEEDKQEGELDKDGRFIAKLDVSKTHKELAERDYQSFQDVTFTAYLTDPTTHRTEQRRFDVRLTKEPIHVYFIRGRQQSKEFPSEFYLSTYYPDGTPAECQVTINEIIEVNDKSKNQENHLRTVKTNRYGVAKVENLFIRRLNEDNDQVALKLLATDGKGRSGNSVERYGVRFVDQPAIRINTDKSVYRAGEAITLQIAASRELSTLFVEVQKRSDRQQVFSKTVHLFNGQARLVIPYQPDFKGDLKVLAYTNLGRGVSENDYPGDGRAVFYQSDDELKIGVTVSAQYRPGEEAAAALQVNTRGAGVESALGLTVFDKAIDERVRTDNESRARRNYSGSDLQPFTDSEQISGVNRRLLNRLDLSKPLPKDLQLVAEILFSEWNFPLKNFMGISYTEDYEAVFKLAIEKQFSPILAALNARYEKTGTYPTNGAELRRELSEFNLDFEALRDPWGMPYRDHFYIETSAKRLDFICAGVDRKFATADDFVVAVTGWRYFKPLGETLDRALNHHHQRTGAYLSDLATLKAEMLRQGVDLSALRDPWGHPYRIEFGIIRTQYTVAFLSGGANGHFETGSKTGAFNVSIRLDDFTVWTSRIDYTSEMKATLEQAINEHYRKTNHFPQNRNEFAAVMKEQGVDFEALRDGWGSAYYATFKTVSRYGDRMTINNYGPTTAAGKPRTDITPVTRQITYLTVRSRGEDGKENTPDDFDVTSFSRIVAEQSAIRANKTGVGTAISSNATGIIVGLVTDPSGAAIANTKVIAKNQTTGATYETTTNDAGDYVLNNLPVGSYDVKFEAQGFKTSVFSQVPVRETQVIELNVDLSVGAVTETVMVTAQASAVQTEVNFSAETIQALPSKNGNNLAVTKSAPKITVDGGQISKSGVQAIATPRLREYFPETLYWQPEIITDAQGRAQVKFKLADNITTWKLAAIASTKDGRVGVVEKEIRAFQPFFVDHDPPRLLTEGDEIALPVVLRNYLNKAQTIKVELKPETWFVVSDAPKKQIEVNAGEARRATFDIRAVSSIKEGKQRITAMATEASDAIEKPVTVHPDGEEISQSATQLFGNTAKLEVNIPAEAIKNSTTAELKIYPNLLAHVFESIEAIMQRPYGCAEQTISAAYPSLLAFRHLTPEDHSPMAVKARRYLQSGYEKLLAYRMDDGGFSYWGRGSSDTALTAYALKFLSDASPFIAIDAEVIKGAQLSLMKKQQSDGSWEISDWQGKADSHRTLLLTAYIARVLSDISPSDLPGEARGSARRALNFLTRSVDELDEPYLIASFALAAMKISEQAKAARAIERLQALARNEADGSYWALETNTPFYGWGLAGRIETTAIAVKALTQQNLIAAKNNPEKPATNNPEELINRGLNFLLRNKDRYGVWYSTQATVNVLEALMTILSARETGALTQPAADRAEIFVGGKRVDTLELPAFSRLTNPLTLDLSKFLSAGKNLIEIRRASSTQASAQAVVSYYQNWSTTNAPPKSTALRLAVNFDKTQTKIGEEIICTVEAERIGFRGYGMMLAEIGLPPGAEVDRASLERAMTESGWSFSQYDVLPDRVIVYLWPRAGGSKFQFKFRPRFGIQAKTAASVLYDYYNPEAQTAVAPTLFVVR